MPLALPAATGSCKFDRTSGTKSFASSKLFVGRCAGAPCPGCSRIRCTDLPPASARLLTLPRAAEPMHASSRGPSASTGRCRHATAGTARTVPGEVRSRPCRHRKSHPENRPSDVPTCLVPTAGAHRLPHRGSGRSAKRPWFLTLHAREDRCRAAECRAGSVPPRQPAATCFRDRE